MILDLGSLDKRSGILIVAERLFAEQGFEKTSVSDIARELRISNTAVYRFFPSKAAIAAVVVRQLLAAAEDAADGAANNSKAVAEK